MFNAAKVLSVIFLVLFLSSCAPKLADEYVQQTMMADFRQTLIAENTATAMAFTPTPKNTPTPRPTPTPNLGSFNNPIPLGISQKIYSLEAGMTSTAFVIETLRGQEANGIAKSTLGWIYSTPRDDQEYLGIKVHIKFQPDDPNEENSIYPYWHFTLRYQPLGPDTWSEDGVAKFAEGYMEIEGEGWIFFLIRKDSDPLLYFQPFLMMYEQYGIRDTGVFFSIE